MNSNVISMNGRTRSSVGQAASITPVRTKRGPQWDLRSAPYSVHGNEALGTVLVMQEENLYIIVAGERFGRSMGAKRTTGLVKKVFFGLACCVGAALGLVVSGFAWYWVYKAFCLVAAVVKAAVAAI